jgi:branched-chain amino acid transport system substrate-binding protein
MKNLAVSLLSICLILVFILSAAACKLPSQSNADQVLRLVQQDIEKEMKNLDREVAAAAQKLSGLDLTGAQARSILTGLLPDHPYVVDACTINRNGKILALEPAAYHEFEGFDISQQEQVIRLFRTQKAVLSQNFRAVEGFEAADLEHPVFSPDKKVVGAVSVLFKPEILLGEIVSRTIKDTTFSVMLMQPDGRVIYDADEKEIGKNTFLDPLYQSYPQLLDLAGKVSAKESGAGRYEFLNTGLNTSVQKEAIWVTFILNGAEWRIVLISTVS